MLDLRNTCDPPATSALAVATCRSIMKEMAVMNVRMNTTSAYIATVRPVRPLRASG